MDQIEFASPWTQMVEEPTEWYEKFEKYYLPLGPGRTIMQAFIAFAKATSPEQSILMTVSPPNAAPHSWSQMSNQWQWRKRALAWDAEQVRGAADQVMFARQLAQMATVEAVQTLRKALANPKTAVQAAKELLDRGGVPSVTIHAVKSVPFTADDLAQAARELEEWKNSSNSLENSTPNNLLDASG